MNSNHMLFDLFILCLIGVCLILGLIAWLYDAVRGLRDALHSQRLGSLPIRIVRRAGRRLALVFEVRSETVADVGLTLAHLPVNPSRGGALRFRSDFPCRRSRS